MNNKDEEQKVQFQDSLENDQHDYLNLPLQQPNHQKKGSHEQLQAVSSRNTTSAQDQKFSTKGTELSKSGQEASHIQELVSPMIAQNVVDDHRSQSPNILGSKKKGEQIYKQYNHGSRGNISKSSLGSPMQSPLAAGLRNHGSTTLIGSMSGLIQQPGPNTLLSLQNLGNNTQGGYNTGRQGAPSLAMTSRSGGFQVPSNYVTQIPGGHPNFVGGALNDSFSTNNQSMYQNMGPGSAHQTPGAHHAPTPSTGDVLMVHDLKKEMRRKEQDFQKQNAILKQQVQLLEMQAREFDQREEKLKKMHQSMLRAVNTGTEQNSSASSKEMIESQQREVFELTQKHTQSLLQKESKIKDLEQMLQQKEYKEKKLILEMEEKQISNERQVQDLQLDKRKMENRIKHLENDLSQNQIMSEDSESKGELMRQLNEQSSQIDEMVQNINALEIEKKQQEIKFNSQKQEHQSETERTDKIIEDLQKEANDKEQQTVQLQGAVHYLQATIDTYERQMNEMEAQAQDIMTLIRTKDEELAAAHQELQLKARYKDQLEQHIQQMHLERLQTSEQKIQEQSTNDNSLQVQRMADELDFLKSQIQKQEDTIETQQQQLKTYKNLEEQLDKGNSEQLQIQKLQEQMNAMKNEEQHKNQLILELQKGNDQMCSGQSPIRLQNVSNLMASRDFQQTLQGLQNQQEDQLIHLRNVPNMQTAGSSQQNTQTYQNPNDDQRIQKEMVNNTLNLNLSTDGQQEVQKDEGEHQVEETYLPEEDQKMTILASEFDLLQSCQKIIDAASSMKCIQCQAIFHTTDFYDHIIVRGECGIEEEDEEQPDQILQNLQEEQPPRVSQKLESAHREQQQSIDLNHLNLGIEERKISSNSELHVYQALNMPLQYNREDNLNYQTQNTVTTNNEDKSQIHTMENSKLSAGKASKNFASKKSSQRSRAIPQANNQGGGQSAYASRSGHYTGRQTGITGNSNLLMTLSRSDMESDNSPLKNDEEIKELAQNYRQNLITEEEQPEEITGPLSNIEGMMAVVGTLHSQSGFTGAAATQENLLQNYLTNNSQQIDKLESEKSQVQEPPIEFHPNNFGLMSCGSDEEELNNKDDHNGQNMSIQSCSQNDANSNSVASLGDATNPQHMLSQSLRDIVTNNISDNQIAAILDNDTLQTYTNNNSNCMDLMMVEHNMDTNVQITDQNNYVDINSEGETIEEGNSTDVKKRQELEKLYDLDTSRFEEEYSLLSSSKKKMLLGSNNRDLQVRRQGSSQNQPFEVSQKSKQSQNQNFVDIGKFNQSLDHGNHKKNLNVPPVKVVGLNLAPVLTNKDKNKPAVKYDLPRQIKPATTQNVANNQFESSLTDTQLPLQANQNALSQKPKFDISKQLNAIKQKQKITSENIASSSKKSSEKKKQSAAIYSQMKKKPNLNIEINEEEDHNQMVVIKPNNIITDQLNANSVSETCLDDLITHKNVMESFRKYQQNQGKNQQAAAMDIVAQQFQSVSSKNGTQNFDFNIISARSPRQGITPTGAEGMNFNFKQKQTTSQSRKNGSNRYQNNMVITNSGSSGSEHPIDALLVHQRQSTSSNHQVEPQMLLNENIISSSAMQLSSMQSPKQTNHSKIGYQGEDKTVEQHNLRQISNKYQKRRQEIQQNYVNGQLTDRSKRLDTSGFDPNLGSELSMGVSPLSKRIVNMQMVSNQPIKTVMGGHTSYMPEQINESEEGYSEYTKVDPIQEEAYDSMQEILEFEQANAAESNAGFQSHRHHLGQKHTIIKPTLMADQEIKIKNSNFQLQELRRKIVMSQENSGQVTAMQMSLQGTHNTQDLLNEYDREQRQLHQKRSPQKKQFKNSDHIRASLLMMSNGRSPRYPVNGSSNKKIGLMEVNEVGEDCQSFIDDLDFEEHPDTDTANRQSNITEGGPSAEMMQQPISYSNVKQNNYNAIVRKVPKDPLKNSLFHNIHTQRSHAGMSNYQTINTPSVHGSQSKTNQRQSNYRTNTQRDNNTNQTQLITASHGFQSVSGSKIIHGQQPVYLNDSESQGLRKVNNSSLFSNSKQGLVHPTLTHSQSAVLRDKKQEVISIPGQSSQKTRNANLGFSQSQQQRSQVSQASGQMSVGSGQLVRVGFPNNSSSAKSLMSGGNPGQKSISNRK